MLFNEKGPRLPASDSSAMSIQFWDSLALDTPAESDCAMGRTQPPPPHSFLEPRTYFTLATLFRIHLKKKGQEQHKNKVYEVDDEGDYIALIRFMPAAVPPGSSDYSDDPTHNLSPSAEGHGLSDKLYSYPVHGD